MDSTYAVGAGMRGNNHLSLKNLYLFLSRTHAFTLFQ